MPEFDFGINILEAKRDAFRIGFLEKRPFPPDNDPRTGQPWIFTDHVNEQIRVGLVRLQHAGVRDKHSRDVGDTELDDDIVEGRPG